MTIQAEITDHRVEEFEKDLGEDDRGRPMITMLRFRHETVRFDVDVRPHIYERDCSWYNCHKQPVKGSPLEEALKQAVFPRRENLPILSGIRSVSEDGREVEFCWR